MGICTRSGGAKGAAGAKKAVAAVSDETEELAALARAYLRALADQLTTLEAEIAGLEKRILGWHRANEAGRRLGASPGVGPITATAIDASVPDPSRFRSRRQVAAWLGLTPRACSSGGKERQAGISRMVDGRIRRLLVVGATAMLRIFRQRGGGAWIIAFMARKKPKAAAVALANKTARVAWALMARGKAHRPTPA